MHSAVDAELFPYGIHSEDSDIRAHVSVVNRTVYVFETFEGIKAAQHVDAPLKRAFQDGVRGPTAEGRVVKVEWISDLRRAKFHSWPGWDHFSETLSTSEKGRLAVNCVLDLMRRGRFPFWIDASEDDRKDVQLKGTDILVLCKQKIQVKCDYKGGDKPAGTGNLFLQVAERNPLGRF